MTTESTDRPQLDLPGRNLPGVRDLDPCVPDDDEDNICRGENLASTPAGTRWPTR